MKKIKSEYVWKVEPSVGMSIIWKNIVDDIIYELENSKGKFDSEREIRREEILNKFFHRGKILFYTSKKNEICIEPKPKYYNSYVILRKEKKYKSEINFDDFKPSKTLVDRYSLLLEMTDDKIPTKVKFLINEYLNDIKKDLPDNIFDSEKEILDNFYLWVKKKAF